MQSTVSGVTARQILAFTITIYASMAVMSFLIGYITGEADSYPLPTRILDWATVTGIALILEYSRKLSRPQKVAQLNTFLIVIPALTQMFADYFIMRQRVSLFQEISLRANYVTYTELAYWMRTALLFISVIWLRSAYISYVMRLSTFDVELDAPPVPSSEVNPPVSLPSPLLGRGDSYVERVIRSVLSRSARSERIANFSLAVMLILVFIGGMSSFGLWVFTHADRINTLESERNKMLALEETLQDLNSRVANSNDGELKERLDRVVKFIKENYATSPNYEATLNRLSQQSQTNIPDIAIRVTIAVLTIFLVQVFFSVYKYNRHLSIMLAAKAEALELAGQDEDARKSLSLEAVSIVKEGLPGFGPSPRTPLEEAIRIAEKLKKSG